MTHSRSRQSARLAGAEPISRSQAMAPRNPFKCCGATAIWHRSSSSSRLPAIIYGGTCQHALGRTIHSAWTIPTLRGTQRGSPTSLPLGVTVSHASRFQMRAEQSRLDPVTWVAHGLDVIVAQQRLRAANATALDREKQDAALEFLIQQMASTASEMKAALVVVYLPDQSMSPSPEVLSRSAEKLGYRFLDLTEVFVKVGATARAKLYLPNDGHPSPAGHTFIAQQLIAFIRQEQLLPP